MSKKEKETIALAAIETVRREFRDREIKYPKVKDLSNMIRVMDWDPELVKKIGPTPINKMLQRFMGNPL